MTEERYYVKKKKLGKMKIYDNITHRSLDINDTVNRLNNGYMAGRKLMREIAELNSSRKNTEEYNLKEIHEILIDAHKDFLKYQENMSFSDHLIVDKLFESIYTKFGILEKKWKTTGGEIE